MGTHTIFFRAAARPKTMTPCPWVHDPARMRTIIPHNPQFAKSKGGNVTHTKVGGTHTRNSPAGLWAPPGKFWRFLKNLKFCFFLNLTILKNFENLKKFEKSENFEKVENFEKSENFENLKISKNLKILTIFKI